MSDLKSVFKSGWHPKGKDGGKESWRGDFKGVNQVASWMGKGKGSGESAENTHISRPLAALKDPSSFGPPPKNVNYHGGAALPNEITPHRGGLGAPLRPDQLVRTATPQAEKEQQRPVPSLPYRADRTGLRTDNLPPPPKHTDVVGTVATVATQSPQASRPTPSLPPRLPSRQNTVTSPPPPPSYDSATNNTTPQSSTPFLNQSAINRLGNSKISVPDLGIGKSNTANPKLQPSPQPTESSTPSWKSTKPQLSGSGLSELQSRFSRMNNNSNSTPPQSTPATATSPQLQTQSDSQLPTWQQTSSALKTANSAYKDPTSITLQDAQSAAATAQSAQRSATAFRERHNETITAAQTRASQLNKRYNMTGRLNKFLEDANDAHDKQQQGVTQPGQQHQQQDGVVQTQAQTQGHGHAPTIPAPISTSTIASAPTPAPAAAIPQSATPELAASISRKPPPPPPPKKPASMQAPPPVPLGTKPNFG